MAAATSTPKRTRCTKDGCRKLAPKGRRRCDDHKPGARPATAAAPSKVLGIPEARLFTPPKRPLTRQTTRGYEVIEFARLIGEPLLPWQEWAVTHALELNPDGTYRFRTVLIIVARQNGKAMDIDTEILTSRGFVTMADIVPGDEVYHPAGHLTRVTAVSEIMTGRDCFQVTSTDGRAVVADREHLWTVTDKRRYKSKGPRGNVVRTFVTETMTTGAMAEAGVSRYTAGGRVSTTGGKKYATNEYRFVLPTQEPVKSPDVELPIDPYVLGAWLGDGTTVNAGFTCADPEIIDEIRAAGIPVIPAAGKHHWRLSVGGYDRLDYGRDTFQGKLRSLGLLGNKHVPDLYLTAGTSQREALLQGLMDTDGTVNADRSQVEFCSTLRPLADAVLFLARSLGWRATIREGRAMLYGKDCGPKYRVFFTPVATDPYCPFRLPRKVARIKAADGGKGRNTLSIASIEPAVSRPVRCIEVESPDGLFLAGRDLIPTHNSSLKRTVTLWRMYMDGARDILGVAQDVSLARKQWNMCQDTIRACPDLQEEFYGVRNVNGDEMFWAGTGCYAVKAANDKAGRGTSNDEVNIDELRTQTNWKAWGSLSKTTRARRNSQVWAMSNAGSDESVVLNQLRESALAGRGDSQTCILEWSGPEGCELDDVEALRQANPALGHLPFELRDLLADLENDPPDVFRTEVLCQRVRQLSGAVDLGAWTACSDPDGTMDALRDRIAAVFDIAPDGKHATLAVSAVTDSGKPRIEIAGDWPSAAEASKDLPALLAAIKPGWFGWFPGGPSAGMAPMLRTQAAKWNKYQPKPDKGDPPAPPKDGEIKGAAVGEACQGLASLAKGFGLLQSDDPMLNAQVAVAKKLFSGDSWRFVRDPKRTEAAHVDGAYAAAGAVQGALMMPKPRKARIRLLA